MRMLISIAQRNICCLADVLYSSVSPRMLGVKRPLLDHTYYLASFDVFRCISYFETLGLLVHLQAWWNCAPYLIHAVFLV